MPINEPSIEKLMEKTDSPYTLVAGVAKRSRQLLEGMPPLIDPKDRKPIAVSIDEINRGLIAFHRNLEDED